MKQLPENTRSPPARGQAQRIDKAMTWKSRYSPPDSHAWQGRPDTPDASCLFQMIQLLNLQKDTIAQQKGIAFALLGFCCDEGVRRNLGRVGAAEAPPLLRHWLAKLPIQKNDFLCYDIGNMTCTDGDLESAQQALGEVVALLLQHGFTPIVIGGGHEMAWGHYQGIAAAYPHASLSIINFDAHFDMRPLLANEQGSSGTPFLQIAQAHQTAHRPLDYSCIGIQQAGNIRQLFETANAFNVQTIFADELHQQQVEKCNRLIKRLIDQQHPIYVSLCLDVFALFSPGAVPHNHGLTPASITHLRQLAASGVISYDLAELSPNMIKMIVRQNWPLLYFEIMHHHRSQSKAGRMQITNVMILRVIRAAHGTHLMLKLLSSAAYVDE